MIYVIGVAAVIAVLIFVGILIGRRNKDKVNTAIGIAKEIPRVVTGTSAPTATTATVKK